jgi:Helix-turn-helix domain
MNLKNNENNNAGDNSSANNIYPHELTSEKMLTIADITKAMRVSDGTVRLWMYGEGLPFLKIRGRVWIRELDLARWLSEYRVVIKSISERVERTKMDP